MRKTKIIATLGPSSIDKVKELSQYVDIFRINFAHGATESHKEYFEKIKEYSDASILVDLPGPKIRVGDIKGKIVLKPGDKVVFSPYEGIPVEDPLFYSGVKENSYVLIADGSIKINVTKVEKDRVEGVVIEGGTVTSRKGINIPDIKIPSGVTDNDLQLLKEALDLEADFIGLSFVLSKDDVLKVKSISKDRAWIIAKIEKKNAVENLKDIIKVADGVMVARGDLGVEIGLENLPFTQKKIIRLSKLYGKPVILATQVLESMVNNPIPTRAEVIDISNSVSEGVDAIMLSDETAAGNYPVEAVKTLHDIILAVEKRVKTVRPPPLTGDDAIAVASVNVAEISKARLLVVHSRSGTSIIRISRLRPKVPIIGLSPNKELIRKLKICWGVYPFLTEKSLITLNDIIVYAEEISKKFVKCNDNIVITGGDPTLEEGRTDFIKLHQIVC
ncbi:pyruvate kinase [Acidianus ambivalens]|uniref:Pyruvate kinase n=1 Tax=Acidianus ambivalens TaxID=2283 RepID=A0A650CVI6_ACIAM|nr:pyruvate kinase [Acidianus ambivalens]MQL55776.1 pyruvate kinase [Acidianus ambivalens]QGR21652.1 pyruvate kinase [Acidianus ambivalens]